MTYERAFVRQGSGSSSQFSQTRVLVFVTWVSFVFSPTAQLPMSVHWLRRLIWPQTWTPMTGTRQSGALQLTTFPWA